MKRNVFDLVMEREKMMENLYLDLLKNVKNPGIRSILTMLAEDEGKHRDHFAVMKESIEGPEKCTLLADSKEILSNIKTKKDFGDLNVEQIDLYRKIRDYEKESQDFFTDLAAKEIDEKLVGIYSEFAEEEHRHYLIMDEICDFVSRPEEWMECSEFSTLSGD